MSELKFGSFNTNGLGDSKKRRDIFTWLKKKKIDVIFLQETHCTQQMESYWKAEWGYEIIFSSYSSNSRGVAILFNNTFEFTINKKILDPNGRFIIIDIFIYN